MKKQLDNKQPLVSIVMPVYNAGKYLAEAIDSVLAQTYQNYKLIIVDDCSEDNSWKIIQRYQKKYPQKIKAKRLKLNTNAAGNGAVNAVFPTLKGKYIARMDADDIAHPRRIEKQVNFMESHTDAILVGTQAYIINEDGKKTGVKTFPADHESIYAEYFTLHPILHPSVMVRKSRVPHEQYLYEDKYGINDDYYTFFKFLRYGKFYNLDERLLQYRMHKTNASLQNPKAKFINSLKIRFEAMRNLGYKPTVKGMILLPIQTAVVLLLPEKYIVPVYFMVRGIAKPKKIRFQLKLALSRLPNAIQYRIH